MTLAVDLLSSAITASWPAWTDPNATGVMSVRRFNNTSFGSRTYPLFVADSFTDGDLPKVGDYATYEFCVNSHGGLKTCENKGIGVSSEHAVTSYRAMHPYNGFECVGVDGSGHQSATADGNKLLLWECLHNIHEGIYEGQLFASFSDGTLRDRNSRKCVTPMGDGPGWEVAITTCRELETQKWEYDHRSSSLRNQGNGLCVETFPALSRAWGTRLVMGSCTGELKQKWKFDDPPR